MSTRKSIIILSLLICLAPTVTSANKPDGLYLSVTLTRSEHSKDSNSTQMTITVAGKSIVYDETHSGYRAGKPVHKEQTLTAQEIGELKRLIIEKKLLSPGSSVYPPGQVPSKFYDLTVEIRLQGKKSLLRVAGPTNSDELTHSRLYQETNALLEKLTALMNKSNGET